MKTYGKILTGVLVILGSASCVAWAGDTKTLSTGGRTVLEYRQTPNPNKVYVRKLYSPAGVQVLLDSPPDHVHHHGLMYALVAQGISFWVDGPKHGVQQPRAPAAHTEKGLLEQTIDWTAPDGHNVLEERRRIAVTDGTEPPVTLLTWTSRLAVPSGNPPVPLFTTQSYVGLGFRFPKSMDRKAVFHFPDGKESTRVRNTEKVTRDRWCACVGPVEGKTVTVAMFSHPGNFRHPTSWFTMSDALTYMTATLNLYRQPLTLKANEPLELTYGVAVWDGETRIETIEALYRRWRLATPAPEKIKE